MNARETADLLLREARQVVDAVADRHPHTRGRIHQTVGNTLVAVGMAGVKLNPDQVPASADLDTQDRGSASTGGVLQAGFMVSVGVVFAAVGLGVSLGADALGTRVGAGVFVLIGLWLLGSGAVKVRTALPLLRAGKELIAEGGQLMAGQAPQPGDEAFVAEVTRDFVALATPDGGEGRSTLLDVVGQMDEATGSRSAAPPPAGDPAPGASDIPAGWYSTPDGEHERWHDGSAWADRTRRRA